MTERNVQHATFSITRVYPVPPPRVFHAFADPDAKAKWFGGPPEMWAQITRRMDFKVGGRDQSKGSFKGGPTSTFDCIYHEIVPNERIIYSYEMHLDDRRISVSLATVEFKPEGSGTKLTVTEQGAFLDGYDDAGSREKGTGFLLDQLGASLRD